MAKRKTKVKKKSSKKSTASSKKPPKGEAKAKKVKPKKKAKRTIQVVVCDEEWLTEYFKKGSKSGTGMTFAKVKGQNFVQLIHKDAKKRGKLGAGGILRESNTKWEPIPIDEAIQFLKDRKLCVIRQVGGAKKNFFKIISLKTAKTKGLL